MSNPRAAIACSRSCLIFRRLDEASEIGATTAAAAFAPVGAAALAFNSPSELNGGANRDRTDDLKLAKLALSQLSYGPVVC